MCHNNLNLTFLVSDTISGSLYRFINLLGVDPLHTIFFYWTKYFSQYLSFPYY
jgi:hypothetical protein